MVELGPLYKGSTPTSDDAALPLEANQHTTHTWMVNMDGELRALPSMPDWVQEALACRPTQAAPTSSASFQRRRVQEEGSHRPVDPDSSTSIEVTRIKRPRSRSGPSPTPSLTAEPAPSSAPATRTLTPADDTGNAERRPSETSAQTRDKKKKKKERKRRKRTRSPSRKRRRRRRASTSPTDSADDPPPEAVDVPIRHVSLASTGPKPADPRLVAVQSADSALEPTSPADGERDRSSVSELEYMFCCRGSVQRFPHS